VPIGSSLIVDCKETAMVLSQFTGRINRLFSRAGSRPQRRASRQGFRPCLEALEDRAVPSAIAVWSTSDEPYSSHMTPGTLRYASVAYKNGDTIEFTADLQRTPLIRLTDGPVDFQHGDVTFKVLGSGKITPITIAGASLHFLPDDVTGLRAKVTLSNLKVTEAASGDQAGGITMDDGSMATPPANPGSLTLNNCTVSGNTGAGIYVTPGVDAAVTLNKSTIRDNTGPGIVVLGGTSTSLSINDSTVSGNTDYGIHVGYAALTLNNSTVSNNMGYGIAAEFDCSVALNNSAVTGNIRLNRGGGVGICAEYGSLVLNNSTVSDNRLVSPEEGNYGSGVGAGIDARNEDLTVNNSRISGNSASWGGGGVFLQSCTAVFHNSTVTGNTAGNGDPPGFGGGIAIALGALTLYNCTVSHNTAGDDGGGIYNLGLLTLYNCTVSDNIAMNSHPFTAVPSGWGGGIYNQSGTATLNNSTVTGNHGFVAGGGIANGFAPSPFNATLVLNNSTISDNTALSGGGIYDVETVTLNNSTVRGNSATVAGGGIYNGYLDLIDWDPSIPPWVSTVTLNKSTVSGNTAPRGGGIYNVDTMVPIYDGDAVVNTVLANRATVILDSSIVRNNSASYGGGIYNKGTLTLKNSTVTHNRARIAGGGIANEGESLSFDNSFVTGNSAPEGPDVCFL
jgi:hypothetical protein